MTTSAAALAATSSAHTSSSVLMSTSLNTSQNQTNTTSANTSALDMNDTNYETKTEFYTREGIWKLVNNCEYARQQQNLNQSLNSNTSAQTINNNYNSNNINNNNNFNNNQNFVSSSNDPVRIGLFKYTKKLIFKEHFSNANKKTQKLKKNLCKACFLRLKKEKFGLKKLSEQDDDDDVIFTTKFNNEDDEDYDENSDVIEDDDEDKYNLNSSNNSKMGRNACKCCNINLNLTDEFLENDSTDEEGQDLNEKSKNENYSPEFLDLILFNYARDIYSYEFNSIKSKNDSRNLVDKKSYKTVMSTCFDINKTATVSNTLALQLARSANSSSFDFHSVNFNISPSYLSLIVAAGFNKGEIHVFDVFKKDASVFYNNSKLVDKTKVTCIKWLPGSLSLFLVSYSSGNIYLYDVLNQTQSTVSPSYTKLCQNDSFSVYLNNNSSTPTSSSSSSTLNETPNNNNTRSSSLNKSTSATNSQIPQQKKLILSNSNQPSQVAKNPLLKLTIGPPESNSSYGVNGVTEFEFSPCGNYLAIVSQDGYLRVFNFVYKSNQQMQLQLRCSMKSYFGGLLCVCWSSDGKYIATGGEDDLITVFSFTEMRVACRGRGHSSWINSCSFDPWTTLSSYSNPQFLSQTTDKDSDKEQENESDLEEIHNKKELLEKHLEQMSIKNKITAPKKRTISTLSDYNCNNNNYTNTSAVFYRLASVGQDNQICFWDLTEDVLKEKLTQNSRSRMTSMIVNNSNQQHLLPQIIIQPMDLVANNANNANNEIFVQNVKPHHQSTASSIVSTARSLFSSKNSASGDKLAQQQQNSVDGDESLSSSSVINTKSSTLGSSFFKRHKRNSSLNSASTPSQLAEKSNKSFKNSPIVLNSYKKSTNGFSSLANENSVANKKGLSSVSPIVGGAGSQGNSNPFNLCPKLDEVAMIEPLICKRISMERLTSIVFKKDCFTVANQDGFIHTWARPKKQANSTFLNQSGALPHMSNESKINSTCL